MFPAPRQHDLDQALKTDEKLEAAAAFSLLEPLWESVVNEIITKLQLPFYEGKSRLIYKF